MGLIVSRKPTFARHINRMDSTKIRSKVWYQDLKGRNSADARVIFRATCCNIVLIKTADWIKLVQDMVR